MFTLLACCLVLVTVNSYASKLSNWDELEVQKKYNLQKSLLLPVYEVMPGEKPFVQFVKGEYFTLTKKASLDFIKVQLFVFKPNYCDPKWSATDMILVNPQFLSSNHSNRRVGVELIDCELKVYVEIKDLFTSSIFTK